MPYSCSASLRHFSFPFPVEITNTAFTSWSWSCFMCLLDRALPLLSPDNSNLSLLWDQPPVLNCFTPPSHLETNECDSNNFLVDNNLSLNQQVPVFIRSSTLVPDISVLKAAKLHFYAIRHEQRQIKIRH